MRFGSVLFGLVRLEYRSFGIRYFPASVVHRTSQTFLDRQVVMKTDLSESLDTFVTSRYSHTNAFFSFQLRPTCSNVRSSTSVGCLIFLEFF